MAKHRNTPPKGVHKAYHIKLAMSTQLAGVYVETSTARGSRTEKKVSIGSKALWGGGGVEGEEACLAVAILQCHVTRREEQRPGIATNDTTCGKPKNTDKPTMNCWYQAAHKQYIANLYNMPSNKPHINRHAFPMNTHDTSHKRSNPHASHARQRSCRSDHNSAATGLRPVVTPSTYQKKEI